MDAYQYFFAGGTVVGRAPVGSFHFDRRDGHQHWHFLQFVRYRLLDTPSRHPESEAGVLPRPHGPDRPHRRRRRLAVLPGRLQPVRLGHLHVDPRGLADGLRRHLLQGVPGQSFDITTLPNGSYWIEVQANPAGAFFDTDASNDVELREDILGGRPGRRTVSVPPWHGIDTETIYGFEL